MQASGVRRLVVQSSLGVGPTRPRGGFYVRVIVPLFLAHVFADKEVQEQVVSRSGLDWTVVYPPRLTNGPLSAGCRSGLDIPVSPFFAKVSRADAARFLLDQIDERTYVGQGVMIAD